MPFTAREIAEIFERIAPPESGVPNDQLGFIYGDPTQQVSGVACMWCAHSGSIAEAARRGLDFLLVHEALFPKPQHSPWYTGPGKEEDIAAVRNRRALLERHRMVVYRAHSNWDALPADGVPDRAVAALGLANLRVIGAQKFFKVHELSSEMVVAELAERARQGLDLPWVRVFGDDRKKIHRFAFLIGGFGENQIHMPQAAAELGAEAVIIGEMNEFVVIHALECGLAVIESLHSASEIPAIRRQAEVLGARLDGLQVAYVASGARSFVR